MHLDEILRLITESLSEIFNEFPVVNQLDHELLTVMDSYEHAIKAVRQ